MNSMGNNLGKRIGLHLRFAADLIGLLQKALNLKIPFFQFFLIEQYTGKYIEITSQMQKDFLALRHEHFKQLYIHGSYWLNGGLGNRENYAALKKELLLCKQLDATHLIVHPGCAHRQAPKQEGFDNLVRYINYAHTVAPEITLVLENSAHGKRVIGGDLADFKQVLERVNFSERLMFCLDTVHAHAYGYQFLTQEQQEKFVQLLADSWGIERIALIHLNDTPEACGSGIDRHGIIGEGTIGLEALLALTNHRLLNTIPVIMEPPLLTDQQEARLISQMQMY